jgi:Cu(I)/Ag(I) efflux system membrane fusion protein
VIIAQGDGRFLPMEVEAGLEANGETEIRHGLQAGQTVVLSGQFLIDSEASLRASSARMQGASRHRGTGKVLSVDAPSGRVQLEHEAIPSLQWPAMTMGFPVEDKRLLSALREGDRVEFELGATSNKDGEFVVQAIRRSAGP